MKNDNSQNISENKEPELKPKKKISRKKFIGIVVVLVFLWLFAIQIMAAERYDAVVNVVEGENTLGINPLNERLDFGDLSRDTGASRFVNLKNPGKVDKFISVLKFGEISELMKVEKNNFTLEPGEEVKLEFHVQIPVSAPYKKYTGKVIVFKYPKLF